MGKNKKGAGRRDPPFELPTFLLGTTSNVQFLPSPCEYIKYRNKKWVTNSKGAPFLRYELLSGLNFGNVLIGTDNRQTESNTYEPTVQNAQVGSKIVKFHYFLR